MTVLGAEPAPLLELKVPMGRWDDGTMRRPADRDRVRTWTRWLSWGATRTETLFLRFPNRFHFVLLVLVFVFSSRSGSRWGFLDDLQDKSPGCSLNLCVFVF